MRCRAAGQVVEKLHKACRIMYTVQLYSCLHDHINRCFTVGQAHIAGVCAGGASGRSGVLTTREMVIG